jgi:Cof subfamily protein (haloacid dehalogenase superfamily)
MTFKMLVSDIDGTLLNSQGLLTVGVKRAVHKLHEQGVVVTLATGRNLRGVIPLVEELGVSVPVILGNGTVIVDLLKKETLLHRPLPLDTAHQILDVIRGHGLWSSVFVHTFEGIDTYYDRDPGFAEAYLFVNRDPNVSKQVKDFREVAGVEPLKVLLIDRPEKVNPLIEDLRKIEGHKFNMVVSTYDFPGYTFLEMFDHASTKASAIDYLAKKLGITPAEVVAVGDNVNDIEMIRYAGFGVAMGQGPAEVKAAADWTTKSNDEDGVAYLIYERILNCT